MKTYVLTVSRYFPKTHKRAGEETNFVEKIIHAVIQKGILRALNAKSVTGLNDCKIHTIRSNYELWAKRIKEIQEGNAILSIRYWSDKPYNSKQVEICQLDKNSGIGIQTVYFDTVRLCERKETPLTAVVYEPFKYKFNPHLSDLAKNDGLSVEDFQDWFKRPSLLGNFAIIHFTSFRY